MHTNVLTFEQALVLTPEELAQLRQLGIYAPMGGAESPDTTAGEGAPSGEGEGESGPGEGEGNASAGAGGGEGGEGDGDDDSDDDVLELSRRDYNRLRKIAREHDKAEKERVKAEKERKEREQREQGRFEEILREKDEANQQTEAERDEARIELYNLVRGQRVERAAKLLGFKDPEDALKFISDEDSEDDAATERALRRVAKKKPYLVDQRRSTGVAMGGGNGGGGQVALTMDQIRNMSDDEINANWPAVQAAMAAGEGQ